MSGTKAWVISRSVCGYKIRPTGRPKSASHHWLCCWTHNQVGSLPASVWYHGYGRGRVVGCCEATTMLKSAEAFMRVMHSPCAWWYLLASYLGRCVTFMNPDGGWRTKHSRLRSSCLRDLLKNELHRWKVRHQRVLDLPADTLTEPLVFKGNGPGLGTFPVPCWPFNPKIWPQKSTPKTRKGQPKPPLVQDLMTLGELRKRWRRWRWLWLWPRWLCFNDGSAGWRENCLLALAGWLAAWLSAAAHGL